MAATPLADRLVVSDDARPRHCAAALLMPRAPHPQCCDAQRRTAVPDECSEPLPSAGTRCVTRTRDRQ